MNEPSEINWQRVREIFEDVLQYPPPRRRSAAREMCGANERLFTEVESLLDSHDEADSFLETPAVVQVTQEKYVDQLVPGQKLLHHEIRELIGKGGMGEVYLARDTKLDRNVAIKLLRKDLIPQVRTSDRLLREARAAALLEHPNICHVYEIAEADGFGFIVMQYIVGATLDELLTSGDLDVGTALDLGEQIAAGLAEAHSQGIIHRDIKPANIIVSEKKQAKILDFGLAKFIEAESTADAANRMESTGGVMGTVPYMSPERLSGRPVDARTDVFSFGAMLFEMISSSSAFRRERNEDTIAAILTEDPDWRLISPILRPLLNRCLAKDPENRYPSASELVEALDEARKNEPIRNDRTSKITGGNLFSATAPVDFKTKRLYSWQSGGEFSRPSSQLPARPPGVFDPPWILLAIAGTLLAPVVIVFAFGLLNSSLTTSTSLDGVSEKKILMSRRFASIPGGEFTMGRNDGLESERPAHLEMVKPFLMDKTEVTNAEYYDFLKSTDYKPASDTQFLAHWKDGRPVPGEENMPVRYVNIDDVNAFAHWRWDRYGVVSRLPTEQEWEFAARNGFWANLYPWGDKFDPNCAFVNQYSDDPAAVGTCSCPNQWGVVDLVGNVMEWTSTTPWIYSGSKGEVQLPTGEPRNMVRGGSARYQSKSEDSLTSTRRLDVPASMRHASLGFRLVVSP